VNIRGFAAFIGEGRRVIHLLVDDDAVSRATGEGRAGMGIADSREALVVDIADRPGSLGEHARQLAGASLSVNLA
jgi:hypothetical protein